MDPLPSTERRKMYNQPKFQRNSTAPAPAARFGRSASGRAAGHLPSASPVPERQRKHSPDGLEYLADASGATSLYWLDEPKNVMVIKKYKDQAVTARFKEICRYLVEDKGLSVTVELAVLSERDVRSEDFADVRMHLVTWSCEDFDCDEKLSLIDFIVCLGGDGTLLYVSSLFQESVPPILAFRLGSLGFLTPLDVDNYRKIISEVLDGSATLTLRARLNCSIVRSHPTSSSPSSNGRCFQFSGKAAAAAASERGKPDQSSLSPLPRLNPDAHRLAVRGRSSSVITPRTQTSQMLVLNEVVIDRGQSAFLSNLEIYCNGRLVTDVQGDGLIVATPTGSTAYAAAAGASMLHPSVQAMVLTPICPHSLSFRPIMVPGGVKIEVRVPKGSRGAGAVSCDGKNRQDLDHGDKVHINMSIYPLPCINGVDHIADWFSSLSTCLHWNARNKQKQFDPDEDEEDSSSEVRGAEELQACPE